ncbi:MAG: TRAP transporter substrate-binding protein [Thermodesulfobacteriota bacterium]
MEKKSLTPKTVLVVGFVIICLLAPNVISAQTVTLKLAHRWVQGDIRDNWAKEFVTRVEKRTKGIKFELHSGGVLFKPQAEFDALRRGAIDLNIMALGYLSGTYPLLTITDLPGIVSNPDMGLRFAKADVGKKIEEIAEDAGMKIISWGWLPTSIGSKDKPIRLPADVKGLKMRAAVKPVEMTFQAAGASITAMPPGEIYMALQTGVLDVLFTTDSSFISFRLYDVVKYLTIGRRNGLMNGSFCIVIRPASFKKLTSDQQKVFLEVGEETSREFINEAKRISNNLEKKFQEKGVTVIEMSDSEHTAWVELAKGTSWKWFSEQIKGGSQMLDLALKVK